MLTLENIKDSELLKLASSLEGEVELRTADKLAKIPDEIHEFCYENRGFFEGDLSADDISQGSICFDINTADKIIYKAIISKSNLVFKWVIEDDELYAYLDGILVLNTQTNYNLTYKNL